ncbi:MAG: hypothetical protein AAFO95_07690, partial [Cyanobacteria bacterium J06600_6]
TLLFSLSIFTHYIVGMHSIDVIKVKKELREVERSVDRKKVIVREYCAIYTGTKEYKFGRWLAKREKQQLAVEIHDFIKKISRG